MEMKKRWKIGVLLLLILLAAVFWKRNLLEINPFHPITADGLYRVLNAGDDGSLLITDRSGRRFYRVNQERQAEYILTGKRNQDGFFDAKQMYEASD